MPSSDFTVDPYEVMRPDAWLYIDEITHRTLNEYTAILALVRRAAAVVLDENSGQALEDVAIRLRAAAASLRALRPPREGHIRDLDQEVEVLCTALTSSILSPKHITLTLSSDPVALSAYRCWQILLVISELITNSARHAFQHVDRGSVTVCVRVQDDTVRCAIADDGTFRRDAAPGRGTGIVNGLIGDLGGSITRHFSDAGTTVSFAVPLTETFFEHGLRVPQRLASHANQSIFGFFRNKGTNDDDA
jgi:two-component sensor histidine kinase